MAIFQFRITSSRDYGKIYQISNETTQTYGRVTTCDHSILDPYVSKRQFTVSPIAVSGPTQTRENGDHPFHQIVDLESQHGTRVNGVPIHTVTLCQGDVVQVGTTKMIYESSKLPLGILGIFGSRRTLDSSWVLNGTLPMLLFRQGGIAGLHRCSLVGDSWTKYQFG